MPPETTLPATTTSSSPVLHNIDDVISNPNVMERIIIQKMFKDADFRESIAPFIDSNTFSDPKAKDLYSKIEVFAERFEDFPMINDVRMNVKDHALIEYFDSCFDPAIDASTYNTKHLLSSVESYVRNTLLSNEIIKVMEHFDKPNFADLATHLPDKAAEVLNFTFDTTVGLDIFSDEGIDRMIDFFHNCSNFIETGISGLDAMIAGGFHAKSLNLFMLPTNKGKSAIMGAIGANMVMQGKNVLYITLEMPEEMIAQRIMSNILDVQQDSLKGFDKSTIKKRIEKLGGIMNNRFRVKEFPSSGTSASTIMRLIKDLKDKQKWEADAIFIDYLGLMKPKTSRKVSAKHEDLKTVAEEIRDIGMEYDIPIISAMQTNREGYDSASLDLSDMSESFGVAMTADVTIAGIMNDELRNIGQYIWRIIKNRFGQNQQEINVGMDFSKMKLEDLGDLPRNIGEAGDTQNRPIAPVTPPKQSIMNVVKSTKDTAEAAEYDQLGGYGAKKKSTNAINFD